MAISLGSFSCVGRVCERRGLLMMKVLAILAVFFFVACAGTQPADETSHTLALKEADSSSGSDRNANGAKELPLNSFSSDHCSYPDGDKTDWWYIDVPAKGKLTLILNIISAGNDLNLVMYDSAGLSIGFSKGGEHVVKEVIEKDVLEGRYYARVYTVNDTDKSAYELHDFFEQGGGSAIFQEMEKREKGSAQTSYRTERRKVPKSQLPSGSLKKEPELPEMFSLEYDQGMEIQQITPKLARALNISGSMGLAVVRVEDQSPAKGAGFRRGDIILAVDERPVKKVNVFALKIRKYQNGDTILFLIRRGSDTLYIILTVKKTRYSGHS
jgi:hypothetical protein